MCAVWAVALVACDNGTNPFSAGGLEGGQSAEDQEPTLCEAYPESNNTIALGEVLPNYVLYDMDDNEVDLCELVDDEKLLFLALTATS
jgi:hypothetical protein